MDFDNCVYLTHCRHKKQTSVCPFSNHFLELSVNSSWIALCFRLDNFIAFFLPPDMTSNFKLLHFFFFCSGLSRWSSLCLFHLLQFSLILACLSERVLSVHPSSAYCSCSFSSMNYYCFLDVVTFCIYHLLPLLSDRIYLKKEMDQERPFRLSHFWHHVSFFIWLEGFFSPSLRNNLSLCFWEVACETVHCYM